MSHVVSIYAFDVCECFQAEQERASYAEEVVPHWAKSDWSSWWEGGLPEGEKCQYDIVKNKIVINK